MDRSGHFLTDDIEPARKMQLEEGKVARAMFESHTKVRSLHWGKTHLYQKRGGDSAYAIVELLKLANLPYKMMH